MEKIKKSVKEVWSLKRVLVCGVILIFSLFLIYIFGILRASNDREWEFGLERLPEFKINGDLVEVSWVRDFRFKPGAVTSTGYLTRNVDLEKLEKVWFLVEPFGKFGGVAHTYFVFDFEGEEPLAVSVEARREKGEKYEAAFGAFNQYELIYVWGTEADETVSRVVYQGNKLYMYPLQISKEGGKQLFLQMAEQSQKLNTQPRFYNTLTSNCTNELAKSANKVKPGAIPLNIAWFLPGYSVKELYKLGYLPTSLPVEELPQRYFISDFVKENYNQPDFSKKLREFLAASKSP